MKKRILTALLASVITAGALVSCGGNGESASVSSSSETSVSESGSESASESEASDENQESLTPAEQAIADRTETEHLVVNWMVWSGAPDDLSLVEDALNELTVPALNIEAEMQVTDSASRVQTLTLQLAGGEQMDIMSCIVMTPSTAIQNEYVIDLEEDDLIQTYGQDILSTMGDTFIDACRMDGVLYGVPNQRDMPQGRGGICVRTDFLMDACESLGLTPDTENEIWRVDSMDTIYSIIKGIHDTHPEMMAVRPGTVLARTDFDALGGDVYGVLENYGQDTTTVVNMFETEEYRDYVENMHELYEYGCFSADVLTDTTSVMPGTAAGNWAAYFEVTKPGIKAQATRGCGMDMSVVQAGEDFLFSTSVNNFPWMITVNTVDKVAAMQYLNFMYQSAEWNDIFCWGIEGVHYVKTEDGHYTYPEGVDANSSGYNTTVTWLAPAQFKAGVWEGDDLDLWDRINDFNNEAVVSVGNGFLFDIDPVSAQYTAVENVYDQYQKALEYGMSDPETTIAEMNEKMMSAGLQDIIDEKQSQFDKWLSYKN